LRLVLVLLLVLVPELSRKIEDENEEEIEALGDAVKLLGLKQRVGN